MGRAIQAAGRSSSTSCASITSAVFRPSGRSSRGRRRPINGEWALCPGDKFFHALEHELGHLPVWAEDLGLVTPEVEKLRDDFDFPGMKVLQFGFDDKGAENPYLPFNYPENCVCYTGTHDNDTTVGWWKGLTPAQKEQVRTYIGHDGPIHWSMIRLGMSSVADSFVAPLQDVLGLGSEARMNVPGRAEGNWSWRYSPDALTNELKAQLKAMTARSGGRRDSRRSGSDRFESAHVGAQRLRGP